MSVARRPVAIAVNFTQPHANADARVQGCAPPDVRGSREEIGYYSHKWGIEVFCRVLKSGCRVETLAFRTAHCLQWAIAINALISRRIMLMARIGRHAPNCEAMPMLANQELLFTQQVRQAVRVGSPDDLCAPIAMVANLGGYRARKHDPDPGDEIMRRDYDRQSSAALGHRTALEAYQIPPDRDRHQKNSLFSARLMARQ